MKYTFTECDEWQGLDPPDLQHDVSRFGHAAEVYTNTKSETVMYMVGGFHGLMMFDTYNYHHGEQTVMHYREIPELRRFAIPIPA